MRLALDIGLAGLALGIERVELEIKIMLCNPTPRISRRPKQATYLNCYRKTISYAAHNATSARLGALVSISRYGIGIMP